VATLFVEAAASDGNGDLTPDWSARDVMKESARIALTWVRSHAKELGIEDRAFRDRIFHIHVPAGAIPKDGPSAGVTMITALASLLTGRPVNASVGMTGEVTLQGRVLPIGGLKQKVLAAHAAGLTDVVLPERNEPDLEEVPEDVRKRLHFHQSVPSARCSPSLAESRRPGSVTVAVFVSPAAERYRKGALVNRGCLVLAHGNSLGAILVRLLASPLLEATDTGHRRSLQ
jgi:ATP-dependent Lon protease